ncbi:MAG: AAA family ATPase [Gemmataceae bacterium]|nr:AAA family ATPase [Gemmataceae bacterium]
MLKTIRIQNFRSLVDATVELDPLTVLIGRSGTGKSNFVGAIRFLRDCLNSRVIRFDAIGGVERTLHVDRPREPLSYDVNFSVTGLEGDFNYHLGFGMVPAGAGWAYNEQLEYDGKTLFHHAAGRWLTEPSVTPTPPPQPGIMLGAIPGLQESTFAYVALRSGIGCYDFPGNVLSADGTSGQPADNGFADRGGNYLLIAERILSDLTKARNWKRIAKGLQAVNRATANLTLNIPTANQLTVALQLTNRLLTFDVRQESEGFRRYLAHLLALYQTPSKQTLLFEHPESGLHPGALESLAHEFTVCPQDGRGQVVLVTHSPQLLDLFPPEAIRVVEIQDQVTRIERLALEQFTSVREGLLRPGELLTVDPARTPGQLDEVPG